MLDGALVNVWRECGAWLRFAETKNVFLFGLLISGGSYLGVDREVSVVLSSPMQWQAISRRNIALLLFLAALAVLLVSFVPSLSRTAIRRRLTLRGVDFLASNWFQTNLSGSLYFAEIARYSSWKDFKGALEVRIGSQYADSNDAVFEQLWNVAQIALYKHVMFCVALTLLAVSVFLGVVLR